MKGNRRYLPHSRAGLSIPCLASRHQGSRVALLKNILLLQRENRTLPGWALIMIKALNLIGFTSLEVLLMSAGKADLMLAVKHLAGLGFDTLADLLGNFLSVTKLFKNDGLPETPFTKKNKSKNKPNNIPPAQSDNSNTIPRRDNYNVLSRRQLHHAVYHNLPDPPADLDLTVHTPITSKGANWPNHGLIGSYLIPAHRTRNAKNLHSLINKPIDPKELSARNTSLTNWILTENSRIINFIKKNNVCTSWDDFKRDKRCSTFNLKEQQFDLISNAALQCLASRHQGSRVALLKNILLLQRENRTLPGWALIMIKALNLIGFTSLEVLLMSAGKADLMLAVKHLAGLGFDTLADLLGNFLSVTKLFKNDGLPETPFTKKNKSKNKPNNIPPAQSDNSNTIPRRDNYNVLSRRQLHHAVYHNLPDPPADLDLTVHTPITSKGANWPNHGLIGSYLIPSHRTRNAKNLHNLINKPINPNELSARNTSLTNWILNENSRIINFIKNKPAAQAAGADPSR